MAIWAVVFGGRLGDRGWILSRQAHQQRRERPDVERGEVQLSEVIRHRPQPPDPALGQFRSVWVSRDVIESVEVVQQFPAVLGLRGVVKEIAAPPVREQLPTGADAYGRGTHVGPCRLKDPPILLAAVTVEDTVLIPRRASLGDGVAEVGVKSVDEAQHGLQCAKCPRPSSALSKR